MESEWAMEMSERDQLWASLRGLRDVIRHLAGDVSITTESDRQIVSLLARIVLAEIDFRERNLESD
jgi:hypothetical protein